MSVVEGPARPLPSAGAAARAKRALDVTVGAALFVAVAPLLALAVLAMALDMLVCPSDRGRYLYRERRLSAGRQFDLLKLRTLREQALARMEEPGGHARPLERDAANLTWAGRRLLKPWYLDELPQLVNVLRGEISLVGPRPWPLSLVERQVRRGLDYRLRVRAGWTGPAQVAKGTDAVFEQLDLAYVELLERGGAWRLLRTDVGILGRTLRAVLRGEGLRF